MSKEKVNVGGRPRGGINRRRSKLRKTEASLLKMNEDAVQRIQDSLDGLVVDGDVLATAKWVVNTTVTVSRAAISEEQIINADLERLRAATEEDEEEDEVDNGRAIFRSTVEK